MSAFDYESARWNEDVDKEAAELVRTGTPPWDAMMRARDIVQRRRSFDRHQNTFHIDVTCPMPSQKTGTSGNSR